MGCFASVSEEERQAELSLKRDIVKIHQFLMGRITQSDLWVQFDTNWDTKVDMQEFSELIYHTEVYFQRMLDPNGEVPSRAHFEEKIRELGERFNVNKDSRISREEFGEFCEYIYHRKHELTKKIRVSLTKD